MHAIGDRENARADARNIQAGFRNVERIMITPLGPAYRFRRCGDYTRAGSDDYEDGVLYSADSRYRVTLASLRGNPGPFGKGEVAHVHGIEHTSRTCAPLRGRGINQRCNVTDVTHGAASVLPREKVFHNFVG